MSEPLSAAPAETGASSPSTAAEPSMEALAALLPDPAQPDAVEPAPEAKQEAKPDEKTEPEAEPKPEEAEAAAEDKAALERAEAAARKAREGSKRYRETLENQRRVQAEAERAFREAAENRRQVEEFRRLQEEMSKDPYAALKRMGMTDQQLAERALREGTPEQEMRVMLQQQQEALAAERQRLQQLEDRLESERQATVRQQAEANFHRIADDEGAYPRLALLAPSAQLAVARAALQQIANNGYDVAGLADAEVAEACERFLAPKKTAKAAPAKPAPAAQPAAAPAPKPGNTSLTNAVSTTKATAQRPWEDLSDDEQIAAIAAALPDPG